MGTEVLIVTGSIGSGKSVVCKLLEQKGIPVYDSDAAVKALYGRRPDLKAMVVPEIFSRPEALAKLENAVYPVLMEDFRLWCEAKGASLVAFESAIILQKKFFDSFGDYVLLVHAPRELRLDRAVARGGRREDMERRDALQEDQRANARVDYVIENDGDIKNLATKLDSALKAMGLF